MTNSQHYSPRKVFHLCPKETGAPVTTGQNHSSRKVFTCVLEELENL